MEPPVGARAASLTQLPNTFVIVNVVTTYRLYSHASSWYNRRSVNNTLIPFRGRNVLPHRGLAGRLTSNARRPRWHIRVSCGGRRNCRLGERHCTGAFGHGVLERGAGTAWTRPRSRTVDERDEGRRALYRRLSGGWSRYQDLHELLVEG